MKKLFSLLLLCILATTAAWGATGTGTITFSKTAVSIDKATVTANDDQSNSWTITTVGTTSFTSNADYYQVGSSKKPATSITFTMTPSKAIKLSAFSIKLSGFSGTAGTVTLKVGDTTVGTGSLSGTTEVTVPATSSNLPTTYSTNALTVTITGISNGVKVYNISYSYEDTELTDPSLTVSPSPIYVEAGASATASVTTDFDGTFSVASQDATIASVSYSNGTLSVEGLKEGSTNINFTGEATSTCLALNKSIKVYVTADGTYNIVPNMSLFGTSTSGQQTGVSELSGISDDGITVSVNKNSSSSPIYVNDSQTRVYSDFTLGLSAPDGYVISSVVFTADGSNWAGTTTANPGTISSDGKSWSGSSQTVTFTFGGTCRITNIAVTYEKYVERTLSSIALSGDYKTTFAVGDEFSFGGTVTANYVESGATSQDVTNKATFTGYDMSTAGTQTVTVSYTENGVTKTATYDITVKAAKTATTLSFGEDYDGKTITKYVGEKDYTLAATLTPTIEGAEIKYTSSDENVAYVLDGEVALYKAGTATITATYEGNDTYAGSTASYTINLTALPAPTFNPVSDSEVATGSSVTITAIEGATITYTVNNGTAQTSTSNSVSVPITEATTIVAFAAYNNATSETITATYTAKDVTLYTVTLADKNKTLTQETEGGAVTLPTRSNVGDWTFVGWSTTNNGSTQTTTAPENVTKAGSYVPTENITLYPVYTYTETTASTVTMAYSGTTTDNLTGGNDAETLGLSATEWSVVGAQGSTKLYPGLNKDGTIRLYYNESGNNTITVSNLKENNIQSIKLTLSGSVAVKVSVDGNEVTANTDGSYTINNTSFVLSTGGTATAKISSCDIIYGTGESTVYYITTPPIPFAVTISPATGTFVTAQKVTMTTEGAAEGSTVKIYYTTDGTEPSASSAEYTEAFTVSATTTIKAYATDGTSTATDESVITISDEGLTHVKNIAEFNDLKVGTTNIVFDNPVTVLHDFNQYSQSSFQEYIWVKDATGYTQIFAQPSFDNASTTKHSAKYENGDVIPAGFIVDKSWYKVGMYTQGKVNTTASSFATATEKALAAPEDVSFETFNKLELADTLTYSNRYIRMTNVKFTAASSSSSNLSYTITGYYADGSSVTSSTSAHYCYNKYNDASSYNKDGETKSAVTVPTDGYYNVTAILQPYNNIWEIMPISFEPYNESTLTLKELVTKGNAGETNTSTVYTISNKLQVVAYYADKDANVNILLVKDDNGEAVGKVTKADGLNDFLIDAKSTFADGAAASTNATAQKDYDQSNWLEIVVPSSIGSDWVNKIIAGSSVKGTYTNTLNPRLVLSSNATFTSTGDAEAYVRNAFCATNFMVKANNYQACADPTYKDEHGNFFFMTPKPCEYGQVVWGVYMAGSFFVPAKEGDAINSHAFYGGVGVNYAYNVEAGPTLTEGKIYQFRAVVKQVDKSSSVRRKASADERTYEAQDEDVLSSDYIVYPFDLTSNGGYVTGADDVNTAKSVSSVRYYNMMGVESATPFDGINIVVTRYNDGSVDSFKVMK